MTKVNMHEAKSNFSKLVKRALDGEEVIVARNGKPLVKLVPLEPRAGLAHRPVGLHRQQPGDDFEARSVAPLSKDELGRWHEPGFLSDE